jgi:hypothetical protein
MSLNLIGQRKTKGMECCARASSRSWGETSTQRAAAKETIFCHDLFKPMFMVVTRLVMESIVVMESGRFMLINLHLNRLKRIPF